MREPASKRYAHLDQWKCYGDIDRPKITIGEGIRLLARHWPKNKHERTILKRLREAVKKAVKDKQLPAKGTTDSVEVCKEAFFRWALLWRDQRKKDSVDDGPIIVAAKKFGVPLDIVGVRISEAIAILSPPTATGTAYSVPKEFMEIHDPDLRNRVVQRYIFDLLAKDKEISRLQKENDELRKDADIIRMRRKRGAEAHKKGKKEGSDPGAKKI